MCQSALFIMPLVYFLHLVILLWFVDKAVATEVIRKGTLINEDDVECRPNKIPDSVADENVDIYLVRKYFSQNAWLVVEGVVKQKLKKINWICSICHHDLHSYPSIILCDTCLLWYHFKCVGLTKQPKAKKWFCRTCYAAAKLQ